MTERYLLSDCNWTLTHNHLVRKRTLRTFTKCLSARSKTKWLWVRVQVQSLKFQISRLFRARISLTFRQGNSKILSWSWICLVVVNILGWKIFSRIFVLIFLGLCFGIFVLKSIIVFSAIFYFMLVSISFKIIFSDVAVVCANFNK